MAFFGPPRAVESLLRPEVGTDSCSRAASVRRNAAKNNLYIISIIKLMVVLSNYRCFVTTSSDMSAICADEGRRKRRLVPAGLDLSGARPGSRAAARLCLRDSAARAVGPEARRRGRRTGRVARIVAAGFDVWVAGPMSGRRTEVRLRTRQLRRPCSLCVPYLP